jgi:hypothetical protein
MPLRDTFPSSALHHGKKIHGKSSPQTLLSLCLAPCLFLHTPSLVHPSNIKSSIKHCLKTRHHHRPAPPSCLHHSTVGLPRRPIRFAGKSINSDTISIHTGERGDSHETIGVKSKALLRCDQIPAHPYLNRSSLQHLVCPEAQRAGHSSPIITLAFLHNRTSTTWSCP